MELADVLDSKSSGSDTVPVRPRPPAPTEFGHPVFGLFYFAVLFLHLCFYILYKAMDFYARNQNFLMNTQPTTGLILFDYLSLFSRLTISSLRILVCSSSVSGYLIVGIAERSIPIAGGIEIRRNIAIAYLPSAAS